MAKPNKSRDQQTLQEQPMVTELLAALQAIEENERVALHFYEILACASQNES